MVFIVILKTYQSRREKRRWYLRETLQFTEHQEGISERALQEKERTIPFLSFYGADTVNERRWTNTLVEKQTSGYLFQISAMLTGTL